MFSIADQRGTRVGLHVRFSHEALPPWMPRDHDGRQAGVYILTLDVSQDDIAEAASVCDREHEPFPER